MSVTSSPGDPSQLWATCTFARSNSCHFSQTPPESRSLCLLQPEGEVPTPSPHVSFVFSGLGLPIKQQEGARGRKGCGTLSSAGGCFQHHLLTQSSCWSSQSKPPHPNLPILLRALCLTFCCWRAGTPHYPLTCPALGPSPPKLYPPISPPYILPR